MPAVKIITLLPISREGWVLGECPVAISISVPHDFDGIVIDIYDAISMFCLDGCSIPYFDLPRVEGRGGGGDIILYSVALMCVAVYAGQDTTGRDRLPECITVGRVIVY